MTPPRARLLAQLVVVACIAGLLAACGLGLPDEGQGQKRYPNILSEAAPPASPFG